MEETGINLRKSCKLEFGTCNAENQLPSFERKKLLTPWQQLS